MQIRMKIEHGKTYLTADRKSIIRIKKDKWCPRFIGHSINGTFMGYYLENGATIGGEPRLANLIEEISIPIINVYTDGSFQNNQAIWGFVAFDGDKEIHRDKGTITNPVWNSGRQIAGECWGVVKALEWARINDRLITIFFDYIGLKSWVADIWGDTSWKTNKEYTSLYREFVLSHKNYLVDMIKVKGHSGVVGNEIVDKFLKL